MFIVLFGTMFQAAIDVADIVESSRQLAKIENVFGRIPSQAKALKQYAPVIGIYKAKLILVKESVERFFSNCYRVGGVRIDVEFSNINVTRESLWESARLLSLETRMLGFIVRLCISELVDGLMSGELAPESILMSETSWAIQRKESMKKTSDFSGIAYALNSLILFIEGHIPEGELRLEFGRRFWSEVSVKLLKSFGPQEDFANLEKSLLNVHAVPEDMPCRITTEWEYVEKNKARYDMNAALAEVRNRLQSDVNRKTMHLSIPNKNLLKSTYIPDVVSCEVVSIAKQYIEKSTTSSECDIVIAIVSLFTVLRQPDLMDPSSIDARSCALFFNDCVYLTLALAISKHGSFKSEILLLRSAASKSVCGFIRNVATRASAHLAKIAGGLVDSNQLVIADRAISDCMTQVVACTKEWTALLIDPAVLQVWTALLMDPILKEMTKIAVENAKSAINLVSVNSGIWSVFRKFASSAESAASPTTLAKLLSWTVVEKVKLALCGSRSDILLLQPLPADESLYGISPGGFEALLLCNPLIQAESKDSIKQLSQKLMSSLDDERMSPKRDFASLFNRN